MPEISILFTGSEDKRPMRDKEHGAKISKFEFRNSKLSYLSSVLCLLTFEVRELLTSKGICMGIYMDRDTGTMDISKDHNMDNKAPHIFSHWAIDESPLPQ
jgi:hypothetical protein